MAARKLTKSPEGEVVTFSTKRGKPDTCSETCGGIYSQLDYIDTLLDQAGGVLEDYTDTPLEELSKDEASDIIDELKGELGYD